MTSKFSPGSRLRSQVCPAEVVVVRSGTGDVRLTCGGILMVAQGTDCAATGSPAPSLMGGAVLGKRYTARRDGTFEVLVVKPGDGTLADGTEPLILKAAKPLPASD
jgi:hypothetical protein